MEIVFGGIPYVPHLSPQSVGEYCYINENMKILVIYRSIVTAILRQKTNLQPRILKVNRNG
jgi:hypothetical protein